MLLWAMRLAAVKQAKTSDRTPIAVLEDIVLGRFSSEFQDGKTVIASSEAGGSVSFAMAGDLNPAEIMSLAMEEITRISQEPDPSNPPAYPPRRIMRLRVSFAKATI
jgi:hypothetical protein